MWANFHTVVCMLAPGRGNFTSQNPSVFSRAVMVYKRGFPNCVLRVFSDKAFLTSGQAGLSQDTAEPTELRAHSCVSQVSQ